VCALAAKKIEAIKEGGLKMKKKGMNVWGVIAVLVMSGVVFSGVVVAENVLEEVKKSVADAEIQAVGNVGISSLPATGKGLCLPATGKGLWIWKIYDTDDDGKIDSGNLPSVIEKTKSAGIQWVVIKFGDGSDYWPTNPERELYKWFEKNNYTLSDIINGFHNAGIKIFGMHYVYGDDPTEEADVSNKILDINGIDGLIIDAEKEYEGKGKGPIAEQYMKAIRNKHPNSFIAYSSFARINKAHDLFPWDEFNEYCDAVMPQCYWAARSLYGITPEEELQRMKRHFDEYFGDSVKPIVPVGQGGYLEDVDGRDIYDGEITRFCNKVQDYGYVGVSLYWYGVMDQEAWDEYASCWETPTVTLKAEQTTVDAGSKLWGIRIVDNPTDYTWHLLYVYEITNSAGYLMDWGWRRGYLDAHQAHYTRGYIYIPTWVTPDVYTYTAALYDVSTGKQLDCDSISFQVIGIASKNEKKGDEKWVIFDDI